MPDYVLGQQLGRGAFGLVVAAEDRRLGRPVAVKVIAADWPDGPVVDFAAEARVLAGLDHPHVVRAYHYVEANGLCLVVMELLAGGTLTRRRTAMPPERACAVGLAVAAALQHAHSRGVLHRDIKPDNVLFAADGTLKVTDFGIAKLFEGSAATASHMAGTPACMAPEQINGGRIGPATDLYALGVLLYQLLTGAAPFDPNQYVGALLLQHLNTPPPPMGDVPAPVAEVVLRALAKNPADRQADARTFALELATAATHSYGPGWTELADLPLHLDADVRNATEPRPPAPPARPAPQPPPAAPQRVALPRRRPLITAGCLALAAVLALGVWLAAFRPDPPDSTPKAQSGPISPATSGIPVTPGQTSAGIDWSHPVLLGSALPHTHWVMSVAFSGDGRTLAAGSDDGKVRLWNIADPAHPATAGDPLPHNGSALSVAISPDGRTLATGTGTGGIPGLVRLWDISDLAHPTLLGDRLAGYSPWQAVLCVAFSPDGRTLAAGLNDGTVQLLQVSDPGQQVMLGDPAEGATVSSVAFSPDGRTLAGGSGDGAVRLWDISDPGHPRPLGEPLAAHSGTVLTAAFSPDRRTLATGSLDGTLRLWEISDPARPAALGAPLKHTGWVFSLAFSPDGRTLASGSAVAPGADAGDGRIRLWNTSDPTQPRALGGALTGHTGEVNSVAFSPDGRILATGSHDRTVRLWAPK